MKRKEIITATCLISCFYNSFLWAQNVKYECSPPIIDERMWMIKQIIGQEGKNLYIFNMGTDVSQIECFNSETLESVYKKTISMPYLRASQSFSASPNEMFPDHNMFYFNGKIVLLNAWFNKKEKSNNVLGQSFSSKDGKESTAVTTIISDEKDKAREKENEKSDIKLKDSKEKTGDKTRAKHTFNIGGMPSMGFVNNPNKKEKDKSKEDGYPNYTFLQSANGASIIILKHYEGEFTFYFTILDFDLKVIDNGEINIVSNSDVSATDYTYDGNGNMFFLLSAENEKDKWIGNIPTNTYKLFSYNQKNDTQTEYEIGTADKSMTNAKYKLMDNTIVVTGFYGISNDKDASFYTVFNKSDGKILRSKENILETPLPEHGSKLEIVDIAFKPNGGSFILAEERNIISYKTTRTKGNVGGYSPTHHMAIFFGDIFIINLGKDNSLLWERKIEKSQKLNYDSGYSSFGYWLSGEGIQISHNEITQPVNMMIPVAAKGITINSLNEQGVRETNVIGGEDLEKLVSKPSFSFRDENKFYSIGKKGKNQVLIKIVK